MENTPDREQKGSGGSSTTGTRVGLWPGGLILAFIAIGLVMGSRHDFPLTRAPAIAVAMIGLLFVLGSLVRPWRRGVTLAWLTLAAPFYAYETYLHLRHPIVVGGGKAARVTELREQGVSAYPALFPSGLAALAEGSPGRFLPRIGGETVLPLGGIPDVETVYCYSESGWVRYKSDRFGFRNDDQTWDSAGRVTFLLGDSYVQGFCLPAEQIFTSLLAPLGEVLSLGINGSSVLTQFATFQEYGRAMPTERVLWLYFEGNDRREYRMERSSVQLLGYTGGSANKGLASFSAQLERAMRRLVDQALAETQLATASHEIHLSSARRAALWLLAGRSQLLIGEALRSRGLLDRDWTATELAELAKLWRGVATTVRAGGGELLLIYVPSPERYRGEVSPRRLHNLQTEEATITNLWRAEGLVQISLTSAAPGPRMGATDYQGLHFNVDGYRRAAAKILAFLGGE